MTIRELCNKHEHCIDCPIEKLCPFIDFFDIPLSRINDRDNEQITKAIIETAKLLTESEVLNNG